MDIVLVRLMPHECYIYIHTNNVYIFIIYTVTSGKKLVIVIVVAAVKRQSRSGSSYVRLPERMLTGYFPLAIQQVTST